MWNRQHVEQRQTLSGVRRFPVRPTTGSEVVTFTRQAVVREALYTAISRERVLQDGRWGGVPGIDRRDDHTYAAVLGEEYGEVCKAWLERDASALRIELIQVAAVAIAWIEELDNTGGETRPD